MTYLKPFLPSYKLTVIKMSKLYSIKNNQWVLSSPNIPALDSIWAYAGMGLMEGTSVS